VVNRGSASECRSNVAAAVGIRLCDTNIRWRSRLAARESGLEGAADNEMNRGIPGVCSETEKSEQHQAIR